MAEEYQYLTKGLSDITLSGLPFVLLLQSLILPTYIQQSSLCLILAELIVMGIYVHRYMYGSHRTFVSDNYARDLGLEILSRIAITSIVVFVTPSRVSEIWNYNAYFIIPIIPLILAKLVIFPVAAPYGIIMGLKPGPHVQTRSAFNIVGSPYYYLGYGSIYYILMNFALHERASAILITVIWMPIHYTTGFHEDMSLIMKERYIVVD